tara:strand:- start:606 stop:1676 length:1071 start_codon:yes stop_codon:yes gene_type:complete
MDTKRLQELFQNFKSQEYSSRDRNNRVLIIDGLNMFIRSFSGSPMMNHVGDHIGGTVGFIRSLFSIINKFKPTRCVVIFDGRDGGKHRRKIFPNYKAGRKNKDRLNRYVDVDGIIDNVASFRGQMDRLEQYLHVLPLTMMSIDYVEADDVIAHIVKTYYNSNEFGEIVIASSDKDFYQLIDDRVSVYAPTKKKLYDTQLLKSEFNLSPTNYLTFRTFDGDNSDNIPGVKGVALKTLLKFFPSITDRDMGYEEIVEMSNQKITDGSKLKIFRNIITATEQLAMNMELMQLQDAYIPATKQLFIRHMMDKPAIRFDKSKFKQLVYSDRISSHFNHLDAKLFSTLTQLDLYAGEKGEAD